MSGLLRKQPAIIFFNGPADTAFANKVGGTRDWRDSDSKLTERPDEPECRKRLACCFCPDCAAEGADLSFGGIGARDGWTTVITRTPVGRAVMADARSKAIKEDRQEKQPGAAAKALKKIRTWSARKSKTAEKNRKSLGKKYPDLQK